MTIISARVAYAVFGDYDGNAPDTADLLVCDTQEEADSIAAKAQAAKDDQDAQMALCEETDLTWPFCDGWQYSLRFAVREKLVRA